MMKSAGISRTYMFSMKIDSGLTGTDFLDLKFKH